MGRYIGAASRGRKKTGNCSFLRRHYTVERKRFPRIRRRNFTEILIAFFQLHPLFRATPPNLPKCSPPLCRLAREDVLSRRGYRAIQPRRNSRASGALFVSPTPITPSLPTLRSNAPLMRCSSRGSTANSRLTTDSGGPFSSTADRPARPDGCAFRTNGSPRRNCSPRVDLLERVIRRRRTERLRDAAPVAYFL